MSKHPVTRYAISVAAVGLAMLLTRWLKGLGDSGISPQFFAAVLLSAWFGGLGPGLLATLLSGAAAAYLLMTPNTPIPSAVREDVLRPVVFMIVAVLASSLHAATRRVAQEADRAKRAAESASAAKSRFLAMVSHELRTPLSPVLMLAEMLQNDSELPERFRDDIKAIRRNVDIEVRLIDDLVDLTRISSGKLHLQLELLDVAQPLQAAIGVCKPDLTAKRLQLKLDLAPDTLLVQADALRLQQVFWNLLRNAIKFTPAAGQIEIHCRPSSDAFVEVRITDSGIGIDPDRLTSVFEAFEQGGSEISTRFGGLGLGLAICRALVDAHGGSITAHSDGHNRGATFVVRLPLAPGQRTPSARTGECADPAGAAVPSYPSSLQ